MPLFQVGEEVFVLLPYFPGLVQIDVALEANILMFVGEALESVEFVKKELQVDVGINDFLAGFGLQGPQQVYGVVINPEIMLRGADNPGKDQLLGLVQALQFPSHQGFVGRPQCAEFDFQSLKKVEEGAGLLVPNQLLFSHIVSIGNEAAAQEAPHQRPAEAADQGQDNLHAAPP